MLTGKFVVLKDKQRLKFTNYDDIPSSFNHVISFEPDYPEPPHTSEQHEEIEKYKSYLQELLNRASGN